MSALAVRFEPQSQLRARLVPIGAVHGMVERVRMIGQVHEESRLPLGIPSRTPLRRIPNELRSLWKKEMAGIGSLARGANLIFFNDWRCVHADLGSFDRAGGSYMVYDLLHDGRPKAEGGSLADMRRFAQGASGNDLPEALRALPGELLEAARLLAQQPTPPTERFGNRTRAKNNPKKSLPEFPFAGCTGPRKSYLKIKSCSIFWED